MTRKAPLVARAFLALALLVAQSGAQAHSYSHRLSDAPATPATLCDECLSFAPVLAAAGGSAAVVLIPRADMEPAIGRVLGATRSSCSFRAFQSRAPPASF